MYLMYVLLPTHLSGDIRPLFTLASSSRKGSYPVGRMIRSFSNTFRRSARARSSTLRSQSSYNPHMFTPKNPRITNDAPNKKMGDTLSPLNIKSPIMARGILRERPTVAVRGDVNHIAPTHRTSDRAVPSKPFPKRKPHTFAEGGHSKGSILVQEKKKNSGHKRRKLNRPIVIFLV